MADSVKEYQLLAEKISQTEKRLEKLRILYEQYFQGLERLEPSSERDAVFSVIHELHYSKVNNTALRFRVNQLVARLNMYKTHWTRITRQIEDGTYRRDIMRARYRTRTEEEQEKKGPIAEERSDTPLSPNTGEDGSISVPGISTEKFNALYEAFLGSKRNNREKVSGLSKQAFSASLKKQLPIILKQHKCTSVEFKVVSKEGKTILKAIPKPQRDTKENTR